MRMLPKLPTPPLASGPDRTGRLLTQLRAAHQTFLSSQLVTQRSAGDKKLRTFLNFRAQSCAETGSRRAVALADRRLACGPGWLQGSPLAPAGAGWHEVWATPPAGLPAADSASRGWAWPGIWSVALNRGPPACALGAGSTGVCHQTQQRPLTREGALLMCGGTSPHWGEETYGPGRMVEGSQQGCPGRH